MMFKLTQISLLLFLLSMSSNARAQMGNDPFDIEEDELDVGGDIFTDFNEDVEAAQVVEDERFYRYGRFFTVQLGLGLTSFDGNRGKAYENSPPSYTFGVNYFLNFRNSFGVGVAFSRHTMFIADSVVGFPQLSGVELGMIDISMLRVFLNYRYYLDTSNLGTAITWSNPYFTGRMEYWYTTNKFLDQSGLPNDSGGGLGFSGGFGLELPLKLKEYYINIEFLVHTVNFHDKYTRAYQAIPSSESGFGYEDLTGLGYSTMVSYVISW